MAELDRTFTEELFTEVLESTPCIIVYSQQAFEYSKNYIKSITQTAKELFDSILGVHECKIVYKGKNKKDFRKYQFIIEELKLSIYVTARENLTEFSLSYISDEEIVVPTDPSEYKCMNLKFLAEEYINHDLMDFLDRNDLMTSYREIKDFCTSLTSLKEPIREINREQSRRMWKAYIDGERALNTDKKELLIVEEVGTIEKEHFNNRAYSTLTLKVKAPTLQQRLVSAIKDVQSTKYRNPDVEFVTNKKGEISFTGYVDITEEILDELSSAAADNCYKLAEDAKHVLSGCLTLQSSDNLDELLEDINISLKDFDAKFDYAEGVYTFKDDSEALYLDRLVQSKYPETLTTKRQTVITTSFKSNQDIFSITSAIKEMAGVIDVLDSVSGKLLIKTQGKTYLNLNEPALQCIRIEACRAIFTPIEFRPDVQIEGLSINGTSYIFSTKDSYSFFKTAYEMHKKVIAAYDNKTFIRKEYDYGCFVIPNKGLLRDMQLHFVSKKQIKIKAASGLVEFYPTDYDNYVELLSEVRQYCGESLSIQDQEYHPSVAIKLLSDDVNYCKKIYREVAEKITEITPSFTASFENDEKCQILNYTIEYTNMEELNSFHNAINSSISLYPSLLTNEFDTNDEGKTILSFEFDHQLNIRIEKNLRNGYVNEDVNLIKASEYDAINEAIDMAYEEEYQDYAEIKELKKNRSQVLRNALTLGRCIGRKLNSIKLEISSDFIDYMEDRNAKGQVEKFINVGDYLQFPMVGKSSELRRLSDSMLRITKPNQFYPRSKTKRIPAPANPRLCDFLFDPRYAGEFDEDLEEVKKRITETKIENYLNEKQLEAVAKAVSAPDIAIIQGPPGTGKTTVIAEIIWQQILKKPDSKILLTSQTNLAVDNALERLQGRRGIRPVRIQNASTEKEVGIEAKRYMLDFMEDWCKKTNAENEDNGVNIWMDSILRDMTEDEKYAPVIDQWKKDLIVRDRNTREQFYEAYKSNVNLVAATCSICGSKQLQEIYALLFGNNENAFDVVIMDEASKATPLEMSVPMVWGKKIIIIGDHKQLPPMMNEDNIVTSLKKANQKVIAETIESFQESQFEILFRSAFKLKPSIVATLDTQYRMHKQIMNTVSHFYSEELEEGLKCGLADEDMDNEEYNARGSRYHGLTLPGFIDPQTHAIWVDVDTPESQPSGSTSYVNNGELNAIRTVIKALQKADGFQKFMDSQEKPEDKEIGIITFYGAQYSKIKEMYKDGKIDKSLPFRINVVDKFQGMERNIIIISTVRSNKEHRYGFAEDIRRINVGFSRARRLLIVVGNRQFFRQNAYYQRSIDEMEHFDIKQLQDLVR
ncbi:MAG: hypothetical protein EGR49_00410 [Prevotella sp.]|nr:hypothetical protein [Prevotella sp.]